MLKLLLGTKNKGKISELVRLFSHLDVEFVGLSDFESVIEPEETGTTFEENAELKASYYAKRTGRAALADDSGLEVACLGGRPGIFSARFAGKNASDGENIAKLLDELKTTGTANRVAKFRCAMSLANTNGKIIHTAVGSCSGHISVKPIGCNGFGYDPVFVPDGYGETFGELPNSVKTGLSHRSAAANKIADFLSSNYDLLT